MRIKGYLQILALLALVFIGIGDRVLPQPLSGASYNTRNTINSYVIGLFPDRRPRNVYAPREEALQKVEEYQQRQK